ncbi:MAG: hypothetical protein MR316_03355 [Lachnospiraceae bacterium]|nr:hypothetical protein [Lachnospiraceae bacterium]
MVNEEKVCKMTKLALDESKYLKEDIEHGGFYRSDYVRSHTMKVLCSYSLSFLLVCSLVCLYHLEYLFVNVVKLNFRGLAVVVGGIYVGLFVVILLASMLYYSAKYTESRKKLRGYLTRLRELEEWNGQNNERGTT